MIRIGEFSRLAKSTVKTLRFYDEIGLFKPCFVDDNGYRYYSIEQLNDLQTIVSLRSFDMPIDQIQRIVKGENPLPLLESHSLEIEASLERNRINLIQIKKYMAQAQKGVFMKNFEVKRITVPEYAVYYRQGNIADMGKLVEFILETGDEVRKNNPTLKCVEPEYCFVSYPACEYKDKDIDVIYTEAVERIGNESENIKFKFLPKIEAISVMHKGSYSELGKTYAFAINYVKENGYEISDLIRERYIDGCWNKEDENDYLTEIQIPIKY